MSWWTKLKLESLDSCNSRIDLEFTPAPYKANNFRKNLQTRYSTSQLSTAVQVTAVQSQGLGDWQENSVRVSGIAKDDATMMLVPWHRVSAMQLR
jgi:hypothetical protein